MALALAPGGRIALVVAGLALAWLGFDRAGWTPDAWPHPFPPRASSPGPERTPTADSALPAPAAIPAFAFALADEPCTAAVRVAVPKYRTAPAGVVLAPVASGREALERLGAGEADAALVTISELVAGWERAAARTAPRIVAVAAGGGSGLAVSLRIADERALETARIAAVPASAEEYLALGTVARTGTKRYWLVEASDADDALGRLERGDVDAAAAPLAAIAPLARAGKVRLLAGPAPLDPAVWVVAGGGCRPALPGDGAALLDLPAAWASAHRLRGGAAPADVLGLLDRPLLRAFLAGGEGASTAAAARAPVPAIAPAAGPEEAPR